MLVAGFAYLWSCVSVWVDYKHIRNGMAEKRKRDNKQKKSNFDRVRQSEIA